MTSLDAAAVVLVVVRLPLLELLNGLPSFLVICGVVESVVESGCAFA